VNRGGEPAKIALGLLKLTVPLMEFAAITETLLIDADGVYDPADVNDRMLLGWHCQVERCGRGRQSHQPHASHMTWGFTRTHRLKSWSDCST
jgi:hypothetical protein